MSDCDDIVDIKSTFPEAISVEIFGGGGDDLVTLGTTDSPFKSQVYANVVVHGGNGESDTLKVLDSFSTAYTVEEVRARQLSGFHLVSNKTIEYKNLDVLDLALSQGPNNLTVVATPTGSSTVITAGDAADLVLIQGEMAT